MQCLISAIKRASTMVTKTIRTDGGGRSLAVAVVLAVLGAQLQPANACMCMPEHPQTHYCNADYGRCCAARLKPA